MQNAQNAEIQQRVINLVELYRTKVGKESQAAKQLAEEYQNQYDREMDIAFDLHDQGIGMYALNIDIPEEDVDEIRANEQLLGHFYGEVAGDDADAIVLDRFLPEKYDKTIFTDDEELFLKSHFREMVNYIIHTPNNDLSAIDGNDRMDYYLIPSEVLELIKKRVDIPAGSKVYNPFTGFAQFTSLYTGCSYFCEESYMPSDKRWNEYCDMCRQTSNVVHTKINEKELYSWMMVALYANKIDAVLIDDGLVPKSFDAVVSYIPWIPAAIPDNAYGHWGERPDDQEIIDKIQLSYQNLPNGGKMILVLPKENCWKNKESYSLGTFWKQIVDDGSLKEVIQLPSIMGKHLNKEYCVVIVEKGEKDDTTFIDARFATKKSGDADILDLDAISTMIQNEGFEPKTGLCRKTSLPYIFIDSNLLVPQVYAKETPRGETPPVILPTLCSSESLHIYDVKEDLPEDTPWVTAKDLSTTFRGAIDISTLEKAGCPNNPKDWRFGNREIHILEVAAMGSDVTHMDMHISEYRNCWYLDGSKDAVLFKLTKDGIATALINASGKAIAVSPNIYVLYPNSNINIEGNFYPQTSIDALSLLALINLPLVYRQMEAYQEFGLAAHFRDILVPTDKRLINDELLRMYKEEAVITELKNDYVTAQKKHMAKLEDYQHAMRKHIREIGSSVRRMKRFINDMDSTEEVKKFLNDRLTVIKTHRLYLSEDIERLNEENTYGEASPFDIDHSLKNNRDYFGTDVCPIKYTNLIAEDAICQYKKEHQKELKMLDKESRERKLDAVFAEGSVAFVDIAEYNFGKIVRNILENAKKHGFDNFTDVNRKDCIIEIALNWDKERQMYRIDFRNNGDSLPEGLTKATYGENRKYAGKTGGTGIGGYEVAENVRYYNGDYDISQDGDWVVVSIYLPKSKIYGERL